MSEDSPGRGLREDTGAVLEVLCRISGSRVGPDLRPILVCVDGGVGKDQLDHKVTG